MRLSDSKDSESRGIAWYPSSVLDSLLKAPDETAQRSARRGNIFYRFIVGISTCIRECATFRTVLSLNINKAGHRECIRMICHRWPTSLTENALIRYVLYRMKLHTRLDIIRKDSRETG